MVCEFLLFPLIFERLDFFRPTFVVLISPENVKNGLCMILRSDSSFSRFPFVQKSHPAVAAGPQRAGFFYIGYTCESCSGLFSVELDQLNSF
jgi:hypothetical protein